MKVYEQDLQIQSTYSDGRSSIAELIVASIANGRKIIGITDHAIGRNEGKDDYNFFSTAQEFRQYLREIAAAKKQYDSQGIKVLAGLEVEIDIDGHMALANGILEVIGSEDNLPLYVDYVIGVIHSESFTANLQRIGKKTSKSAELKLLMQNISALIANPHIQIWGHPFQAIHGHFLRDFTAVERRTILTSLENRTSTLLIEYNLNPFPRYEEWKAITNLYVAGRLSPNDVDFFELCAQHAGKFVISTDAHDVEQTGRLSPAIKVPSVIKNHIHSLASE